jgi:hypothetical protein
MTETMNAIWNWLLENNPNIINASKEYDHTIKIYTHNNTTIHIKQQETTLKITTYAHPLITPPTITINLQDPNSIEQLRTYLKQATKL